MQQFRRVTASAVAIAIAGTGAAGVVPATAAAKASKALTKSQVIALIKQYAGSGRAGAQGSPGAPGASGKDGAAGVTGPTGPQGLQGTQGGTGSTGPDWAIASGSGLQLQNNALSVQAGPGLTAGNNGLQVQPGLALGFDGSGKLAVNIGDGLGVDPSNNRLQVNLGPGLMKSPSNLVQADTSVVQQRVTTNCASDFRLMTSIGQNGVATCDFGAQANTSNLVDQSPVGLASTTDGQGNPVYTPIVSNGVGGGIDYLVTAQAALQNTTSANVAVKCETVSGSTVIGDSTLVLAPSPIGTQDMNLQAWFDATTGGAVTFECHANAAGVQVQGNSGGSDATANIALIPLNTKSTLTTETTPG